MDISSETIICFVLERPSKAETKPEIAVVTVSGRAYYLLVNELRDKKVPFLSLIPGELVPVGIKIVLTTELERHLIHNEKILTLDAKVSPESLVAEALQMIQGKERYEKLVVGIDPGDTIGVAVLADGRVVETGNCFSPEETVQQIKIVLKSSIGDRAESIVIRVGDGVPSCEEKLLRLLDKALPKNIIFESVIEAGTNRSLSEAKNRRGLRDIASATKIAGRKGNLFQRSIIDESES
jgi:hypothetical protein